MKRLLCAMIMTAGMLGSVYADAETQRSYALSVDVSDEKVLGIERNYALSVDVSEEKVLAIEGAPDDAVLTYSITSQDAGPVSGPSGMTIDLTGKYQVDCSAWEASSPRIVKATAEINWEDPELLTESPALP